MDWGYFGVISGRSYSWTMKDLREKRETEDNTQVSEQPDRQ